MAHLHHIQTLQVSVRPIHISHELKIRAGGYLTAPISFTWQKLLQLHNQVISVTSKYNSVFTLINGANLK